MKRQIIHLIFWFTSLGSYLLGDEAVVVSPPASPRISAQADFAKQETAPNKVPVIDIAQPNNAGVSHNCYEKFNVNREGLILNNSAVAAQSKLGGMLIGNANLARTGSASLIVNEVVGPTQSRINGFVEVHGKAADLVVANPNGISVNGGGVINAPKVTLTTGVPEFDANGALQSLLVQQGKVTIGEQGMHVQNCNYCDILANAVEINGAIQGQKSEHEGTDMHVVSGYYRFDYPSRTATEESAGAPILGVDSAALGGMYAGKIYFQTKGRDVGVKFPPNMVTNAGDLVVEADGSIHIAGHVNSTGCASIQSSDKIFLENVRLGARDKIDMSASSVFVTRTNVFTPKMLSLNATDAFRSSESRLNSEKALHIQAGSMESTKDHFASLEPIHFETTHGDLSLKRVDFGTLADVNLQSAGNLLIKGQIKAPHGIALTSTGYLQQQGSMKTSEGGITAQSSTDTLIKGVWSARDGIRIGSDASFAIKNRSLLSSEGLIAVSAGNKADCSGTLKSEGNVTLKGDRGVIRGNLTGKNVDIETTNDLQIKSEVHANEALRIKSGEIRSKGAKLSSNQGVTIESTADDLSLANAEIQSPSNVALTSARDVAFDGSLKTNEAIHLEGRQDVRMKGSVQGRTARLRAHRNLSIKPTSDVKVAEALALEATNDVSLQGQTQSGELTISGANIHVADQHISQGKIDVTAQNEANIQGTLVSIADEININANQSLATDGIINAKKYVTLAAQNLTQSGGIFSREGGVRIRTKQAKLSGDLLGTAGLELKSKDVINLEDTAQIASQGPIAITSKVVHLAGKLDTDGPIDINANTLELKPRTELSGKTLALNQTSDQDIQWNDIVLQGNQQVSVKSHGDVKISGSVLSSGEVMIESHKSMDFSSTDSRIDGKTTLKAKHMLSLSGLLLGLSSMLFSAEDVTVHPQAQIGSHADAIIDAQKTFVVQPNSAVAGKDLSIKSSTVTNEGLLQGSNSVDLNADQKLTNDGQILTEGKLKLETPKLENNGLLQSASGEFIVADLINKGGMWIAGPWTLNGDKAVNTGWMRIDGPWTGRFNTFENQAGWIKGATVNFADPMHWLNKARMDFSGDVLLPQSTFENISASFYSGGDVALDTLRNVNEKEPKVGPLKIVPELCKWQLFAAYGYSPSVKLSGKKVKITLSRCFSGDITTPIEKFTSYSESGWPREMEERSWKEIVNENAIEQDSSTLSAVFQTSKNLSGKRIENSFSKLHIGGNLSARELVNRGASAIRKKEHWKEKITITNWGSGNWLNGSDPSRRHDFVKTPGYYTVTQEIIKSFPSTIQVGGKIQGTVQSFMNGEAVAKDDNIKQGVALPAHVESVWDKEKAALKVLREAHADSVQKLHFATPEVSAGADLSPMGSVAMAAVPSAEVVPVEEDERTQLWRLQVQDFLNEARAEPLVFSPKYDAPYVIETNPMFVDPGLFYGSQYFLDRVDLTSGGKPSIETRLGDAFFENQLIRQQIQAATNRFILSHQYANEAEQQLALYNNALDEARALGLIVGVPLTPDQIKRLKRDLIWLVTEEVDGKQVLVPRVYLCANTKCNLYTSASQVLAKAIDLQVEGNVLNQGLIETEQDLSLQSRGSIANIAGKFATQTGDLSLQADGNVLNISGEIASGKDLTISGKTIVSATTKQRMEGYKSHADVLGATAKISAKDTLHLAADEHLAAVGAAFKGKDVALTSGGDMALDVAEKTYHYQDGGHNWSINEHGAHALQTTIEAGNDVRLLAQDDLKTRAVKVHAGGDFTVKSEHGAVTSDAFKDYDYAYYYSHSDGGFFGGSSTTERTSYKAKDLGSDIVAQEAGTLSAEKDVHLKAGKVAAKDLTLASKTGKVKLEAGEEKDFYHYYHKSSGLITTSVDDEGHDRTTQKPVEIAAQNVTLPSPAEIDYKVGLGKEFREALADRKDINWNAVADNYREWSEHTTTLSGPARMLVACVLTVVTNGLGSEWLAAHGVTEGTAMNTALSAGIQAVTVGAGTSLAGNLGDIGKTFDELTSVDFVKSLASTMLTAGLNLGEASTLKEGVLKGAEKIAIQTTLEGKKVGDILVGNVVDAGSAQLAHTIGDAKAAGTLNQLTHKALHAGLGAASAAITGRDPVGAAIGAVVSETAAEAMDKPNASPEERQKIADKARLIGDTVAFLAGRDVASADSAGKTAVENNYSRHLLGSQFARQEIVNDESLSDEEKRQQLAEVDELAQQTVLAAGKGAALGFATTIAPRITSGYFATQSIAHWSGTYAGGGMEAVKQEFREHPIASTVDLATTGMLGAGFIKGMTRVPQLVETGQAMYKHHKVVGQLRSNVRQGKQFETGELKKLTQTENLAETQPQITIKTGDVRTRVDAMSITPSGEIRLFEFKSSSTAPLTKNQKIAYPSLLESGGSVVGAGKGTFTEGFSIPQGTYVEIIRPKK